MVVAVLVERWACDDRPDPLIIGMTVSVRLPISPKSVSGRIVIPLPKEIRNRPDRCRRARSCDGHSAHDECVASCAAGTTTSWRLIIRTGKALYRRAPEVNTVLNDVPPKRIESTVAMNLPSPRSSSAVIAARAASTQSMPPTRAGNEGVKTGCDQDREVRGPAYSVSIAKVTRAVRQ